MHSFIHFFFLRLHPRYMEVARLGTESKLQLLAYATASVTCTMAQGNTGSLTN